MNVFAIDSGERCPRCATGFLRWLDDARYCNWCAEEYQATEIEGGK